MSAAKEAPGDEADDRRPDGSGSSHPTVPDDVVGRPGDFPGFLFWRASLRWQRRITSALRPFDVTPVQWMVLVGAWLMELEEAPPSQRELADHQGVDVMMTGQVLTTLEKRGLVVRRRDPGDKRVRRVSVTAEGADLAQRSFGVTAVADAEFFSQIEDPDSLIGLLRILAEWEKP